ncbi:hypothetical protein JMJ35_003426 [Cladonia borealis]|uniref:Uncharacterized protein n=1 Tax=Cladonia borealis TaxID=184061 RepID=A0AA39V680_9LECA|nr:hypothetical protein JMJ35_003426 [Cladonia borealis]
MGFDYQQCLQPDWSQHDSAQQQWLQQRLQQDVLDHALLLQGWSSQAWETQKKKEDHEKLKSEPPVKASEYSASPPQLLPPFLEDAMVNNPDKPTSIWFTASECKLVCALTLYVDTRENPPESIKRHGKRRDAYIHEMHDEILLYLRFIFGVPWLSARIDSSGLYDYIKGSNHKPLRNLFIEVREDKYGFWTARARATFQWWVMLPTHLRERLRNEDRFKKMPNGTYVRQDSTLERYDIAKPILDAEYLAARYPETYCYNVKLMPITNWLVAVSKKRIESPLPPPPPIPYWPCNMRLTEQRQTPSEKPHSPQGHQNGWEQRKPAAKKPQRRRHKVPEIHIESPEHSPLQDGPSLHIGHPIGHQTRSKTVPPPPGLPHTSTHHQAEGTSARSVQCPDMSYRRD